MNSIILRIPHDYGVLEGTTYEALEKAFPNYDLIRRMERQSIRQFMEENADKLKGRVWDYGAGIQPYRDLVFGDYVPYEKGGVIPHGLFDSIMCNQVMQFITEPVVLLQVFHEMLKPDGFVVMTFATNWDEIESDDLHRFTRSGMQRLFLRAGFNKIRIQRRAEVQLGNFRFPLGYGLVAQKHGI